jgi:hypothetical protein
MKNEELYDKSVAILTKSFMNGTLQHGACTACAVGNLIAGNCGFEFIKQGNFFHPQGFYYSWGNERALWGALFQTDAESKTQIINETNSTINGILVQLNSTGYHWRDLAKIEYAFELQNDLSYSDECMFNGLMAVVEVLGEIHEVSKEVTEETKLMFVK